MKKIDVWLEKYAESHQNPTNKLIHWFCVPIITFTLLGLLSLIDFNINTNNNIYNINFATILVIAAIIFYIRLSVTLTIGMFFFSGICIYFISKLSLTYSHQELFLYYFMGFLIAWIGQFIGHKIEGKKPSFFDDIKFLLIGPAWLLSFIYKKLHINI